MSKIKSYDIRYGVRNHTSTYTGTETAADLNPSNAFAVTLRASFISYAKSFSYTGSIQTWTAPYTGYYRLEVWGAQGGSPTTNNNGGYGAYSTGVINLTRNGVLYVVVGGVGQTKQGLNLTINGGYNGGGNAYTANYGILPYIIGASGGGATHIASSSGVLKDKSSQKNSIIIVAAGGGGGSKWTDAYWSGRGGNGGGIQGGHGIHIENDDHEGYGTGGTQITGGACYANNSYDIAGFGYGGFADYAYSRSGSSPTEQANAGGGGGGGYFGGGGGCFVGGGGGGGSSYIGSSNLISGGGITKHMTCYSCTTSSVAATRTYSNTNVSETATADYSKTGNGYARITYLGTSI